MTPKATRVGRPWSSQVELVEGCNRYCAFCGLRSIRPGTGGYKYMAPQTAERIAAGLARLNPNARVEFAMHGEPLQHPKAPEIIATFRRRLPATQLMLTTNGRALIKHMAARLDRLYAAGLNFVMVDTYADDRAALLAAIAELPPSIEVRDFYAELAPAGWLPYHNHGPKTRRLLVVMDDIAARDGEVPARRISNHAGNSKYLPPVRTPLKRTCTIPFREISFTWDGGVNLCCNDWGSEYVVGNINTAEIEDIWWHPRFEAARKVLYRRDRGFSPCASCDLHSGYRVGLLPEYPPPGPDDLRALAEAVREPTAINGHAPRLAPHLTP